MRIQAWRVHDTGLVAAPGPFRRLPGAVRHHQGQGSPWPDRVTLVVEGGRLLVHDVGEWPLDAVSVRAVAVGPPTTFVVQVPGAAHLLAAAADAETAAFLALLGA